MRRRLRQHVNPLKASSLASRAEPLAIPDGPLVEVELGCGDASFLIARAQRYPDRLFYGIDIRDKFLDDARGARDARGLDNLELVVSNLIVDAERLFPPTRLHRIYVLFPDPWFKRRQHNRRWLAAETAAALAHALEGRGELYLASDVFEVALEALALFESCPLLENAREEWRFLRASPFSERSSRELACAEEERSIWRLLFRRCETSVDVGDDVFD
jgi:tRNA (guanine-N7-)-methyltransferase